MSAAARSSFNQARVVSVHVDVVFGPARSGKTHRLVDRYVESLKTADRRKFDYHLWIAPSSRSAAQIRESLAAHGATHLSPGITTFADLSKQIIFAANLKLRPISPAAQRELLRRTIATALTNQRLNFFAKAATRNGFIDMLAEHFSELRQHDIRADTYQRVVSTKGQSTARRELALLFAEYDRQLTEHSLCDNDSLYVIARDALASKACRRFDHLKLIVADGFTDFTRIELQLLEQLANRAEQLCVSLPTDAENAAGRDDLFAKPAATLVELKELFPRLEKHRLPERPTEAPVLAYITQHIFRYPQPQPPSFPPPALAPLKIAPLKIIEAAGAQDEIVQLARQIKRLLSPLPFREGPGEGSASSTTPDDILLVFRSLPEIAPRIEEVFSRFGIPFSIEARPRLASDSVFRTILAVLQLDTDDWPFRQVVGIITNNLLTSIPGSARRSADWLVRDLQHASGRDSLLEAVAKLASQQPNAQELSESHRRRVAAAAEALPLLQQLAAAFDQLPREATPTEWAAALEVFTEQLGIAPAGAANQPVALSMIVARLADIERLNDWLAAPSHKLDRRDLLALLIDFGSHEPLPQQRDDAGRVRVLSAHSARSVSARHVFLAGMSEQAFPASARSGGLAHDADYRFLASAAHQREVSTAQAGPTTASHAQDEMLLFYEVISRAQVSLTISYPALDDKAQKLPPSPYVIELQRMFRSSETPIPIESPQLSPVPHVDSISSVSDWRIAALAEANQAEGNRRYLAGLFSFDRTRPLGQAIDAGVRIVHSRAHGETFGPAEGVLISPAVSARLAQRFGAKHSWSPSQFETYASCPYKFFLRDVLRLEPLGDLVLETDYARRGSLLHHVLATFHRKFGESAADWSALQRDEDRFMAELQQALQSAVDATPHEGIAAALAELDRRQIGKWTDQYRGQHAKYDKTWENYDEPPRPAHFELRFGRKHPGEETDEDTRSVDKAFQLDIGGEHIDVAGRIDRIDVGQHGGETVFNVIDYKSGRRPSLSTEKIESGESIQPALYVMAAQALVFGEDNAQPLWTGYWSMKGGVTTDKRYSLHCTVEAESGRPGWQDLKQNVIARIAEIVHAARRGDFPIASRDPHCTTYCDYKTICRIAQARSIGKVLTSPDADVL